jgi:exodeoxyribonuclease VII large subunit
MENILLSVSDFIALTNQTLEFAHPVVVIEGEVSSFKVNQGKFVFFDLKDDQGSIGCFMMAFQLRLAIEDGMKVVITASPKLTQWGKFSLTVRSIRPSGEGSLKKSFDLLKEKLDKEGLFALERKRTLPAVPRHVGVITSTDAAGYADFVKILNDRWGGLEVDVAHVQVQGAAAPDQMIRALRYFNELEDVPQVILLLRGGGSADDLAAFNDEPLVRAVAASRVPTMVAVGHEVDISLADLAADVRAATPSNAAQLLVPDRHELIRSVRIQAESVQSAIVQAIEQFSSRVHDELALAFQQLNRQHDAAVDRLATLKLAVAQINPQNVLRRGYALLRGEQKVGAELEIETYQTILKAEVKDVRSK